MIRNLKKVFFAAFLSLTFSSSKAQEKPPRNFENWGICPFECCTYREWTADAEIPIHAKRDKNSPVLFRVRKEESVDVLTGVVVTDKPGIIKINRHVQDGYVKGSDKPKLDLKTGDIVYMLSPLGEGYYLFWYQGKIYQSGDELVAMPSVDGKGIEMVWWKLIRNKAGKRGWTQFEKFRDADACG